MGLLDRWTKKKKEEQLKDVQTEKKPVAVLPVKKETKTALASLTLRRSGPAEKLEAVGEKKTSGFAGRSYAVLIRPLVTEKSATMGALNKYGFLVRKNTNKEEIKKAIKEVYGVMPKDVNIINVQGRQVRFGRRLGRRTDFKKAIITLKKGETITVHEGV